MAMILGWRGNREYVYPSNKKDFSLSEMYELLECDEVEYVFLRDSRIMVVDRNAKITGKKDQVNTEATYLFHNNAGGARNDFIVGDAIIGNKKEFD